MAFAGCDGTAKAGATLTRSIAATSIDMTLDDLLFIIISPFSFYFQQVLLILSPNLSFLELSSIHKAE
jgi:hypothetical protein